MPRWMPYFLLIVPIPALAQDCTQTVPVRVVDRETAAPIEPLTAAIFTASMEKTSLPVSAPAQIRASRIIVLIDESGSMAGKTTFSSPFSHRQREAILAVKQTLNELMAKLPPGVSTEYGLFNEKLVFGDAFVSSPGEVRNTIDAVTARFGKAPAGHTALFDSLHEALKQFGPPQPGDSIVVLTDGGDNRSKHSPKDLEMEFRAAKARLFTMVVYAPYTEADEVAGPIFPQQLVARTGGSTLAINPEGPSWVGLTTGMIRRFWNERVLTTDVIQVQVPGTLKKEAKWKLAVNPEADARLKHAVVIYPDRLTPCPVTTVTAP